MGMNRNQDELRTAHARLEQMGITEGSTVTVVDELGEKFALTLGKYSARFQVYSMHGGKKVTAFRLLTWIENAQRLEREQGKDDTS